ncbi:MAG: hypothetical protein V4653_21110 [Pseudomonadota bacterium]
MRVMNVHARRRDGQVRAFAGSPWLHGRATMAPAIIRCPAFL